MTTVYFVRHAQPDHGWKENRTRPLTDLGREDCRLVTDFFRHISVDLFYCSPYIRSLDTIRQAASDHHQEIRTDERLRERDSLPGSNSRERIAKRWEDLDLCEEGGESIAMVQSRNIQCLHQILSEHPGKTIVIGTHGTALSSILRYYDPSFGAEDFFRIIDWMPYVIQLDFEGTRLLRKTEHCYKDRPFHGKDR